MAGEAASESENRRPDLHGCRERPTLFQMSGSSTDAGSPRGRYRRCSEVVQREIAGETFLVPIRGELARLQRLFVLNGVARFVWEQLDGERDLDQIRDGVVRQFEVTEERAHEDVVEFVDELRRAELIEET